MSTGPAVLGVCIPMLWTACMVASMAPKHPAFFKGPRDVWPSLASSHSAWPCPPLGLRGGGGQDELEKWARAALERVGANMPGDGDAEVSLENSSDMSSSDLDAAWDRNAARRSLVGIETPHPKEMNWDMSYYDDRGIDALEGELDLDSECIEEAWNTFVAARDSIFKKAGIYESFFLDENGEPPPDSGPFPKREAVPADASGAATGAAMCGAQAADTDVTNPLPWARDDEDATSPDGCDPETQRLREQAAGELFQGMDPAAYPASNMTLAHWNVMTAQQRERRYHAALDAFANRQPSPLFNASFVYGTSDGLVAPLEFVSADAEWRLAMSIVGAEGSSTLAQSLFQCASGRDLRPEDEQVRS